ncbi:hypothetical protein [Streptomyces canus]|uniref:hypothetical protein n=1 Tax=Streptomyces canus TaxID=58343 RepID=UPI003869C3DE|nr:hypothetical protein OH824_17655 [Streptomyces canus]
MNGAATTAEWLACSGIGTGVGTVVLGLLKLGLDTDSNAAADSVHHYPPVPAPPALPARAPQRRPRHAAPLLAVETQPINCVQTDRARHAKKAA